jgi:hypothetical protein
LFALNQRYLINEKGALAEAAEFPRTIPGLTELAAHVWTAIGDSKLAIALSDLRTLEEALHALCWESYRELMPSR